MRLKGNEVKYAIDIEFTGYENLDIEADSEEEAMEKALNVFDSKYMNLPIKTLRNKSTKLTNMTGEWDD